MAGPKVIGQKLCDVKGSVNPTAVERSGDDCSLFMLRGSRVAIKASKDI